MDLLLQIRMAFPNEIPVLFKRLLEITAALEKGWECSEILVSPHEVESKKEKINLLQFLGSNCWVLMENRMFPTLIPRLSLLKHIPGWQTRSHELHHQVQGCSSNLWPSDEGESLDKRAERSKSGLSFIFMELLKTRSRKSLKTWDQDGNQDWNHVHPWLQESCFQGKIPSGPTHPCETNSWAPCPAPDMDKLE